MTASATAVSMSVSDAGDSLTAGSDGAAASEDTASADSDPSSGDGPAGSEGSGDGSGDGSDRGTTAAETTGAPAVECAPLDEDACDDEHDHCMALVGRPFVHENGPFWCMGDEEFVGCAAIEGCDDAPTVACDRDENPWLLPSSCMPGGWTSCDPPGDGDFEACPNGGGDG